ncbi:O-antigen ligase family protein [Candidatus Gracilibacteria bacterium]|nr:O-antigen ligase family protein [Candidatus Gracilibacteria bacterium]
MKNINKYLYLAVFLIPLVMNPWGSEGTYEASKQVWLWIVVGAASLICGVRLLMAKNLSIRSSPLISWVFGAWILSFVLSTALSIAPVESFWGTFSRMQGLVSHVFYGLHFLVCLYICKDREIRDAFFKVVIAVGVILSVHAIWQWVTFIPQGEWSFFGRRSYSFMGNPTALGQLLIFPLWTSLFFTFDAKRKKMQRIFLALGAVLVFIALLTTENRASLLGVGFTIGVLIVHFKAKKPLLRAVLLTLGAAAVIIGIAFISPHVRSLGTRTILWQNSLSTAADRPIFGSGPETYYQVIQPHLSKDLYLYERLSEIPDRAHNWLLDTLVTRGFVGVAIELLMVFFIAGIFVQRKIKTPTALLCISILSSYFISLQFGFYGAAHAVFFAAVMAVLLYEVGIVTQRLITVQSAMRYAGVMMLSLIAVFAFSESIRVITSDVLAKKGFSHYILEPAIAYDYFSRSTKAAPHYADSYRRDLGLFRTEISSDTSYIPRLDYELSELTRITNNSFYSSFARAQFLDGLGQYNEAQIAFQQTATKAPHWPQLWMAWVDSAFIHHDIKGVKMAYEKLESIAPRFRELKGEQERIFRISNQGFYEALEKYTQIDSY